MRSHRTGADGVVGIDEVFRNAFLEEVPFSTTPSAPLKEASRRLLDVASTPPMSGGGVARLQFIHTFCDRAYLQTPEIHSQLQPPKVARRLLATTVVHPRRTKNAPLLCLLKLLFFVIIDEYA